MKDLALKYVEILKKFTNLDTFKLECYGDGNVTNILKAIMDCEDINWFNTVETLKCYMIREVNEPETLQLFFTKFKKLRMFKGIIE